MSSTVGTTLTESGSTNDASPVPSTPIDPITDPLTEPSTTLTTIATTIYATTTTSKAIDQTTTPALPSSEGYDFPYPVAIIVIIWVILVLAYLISRWRQKDKASYIIPRVFVLCSPRTVQFHYELILRIGLPSIDFNPEKHDIDITVQGSTKNEVVPMTRLNTKTLLDEPLITSLSIVVYRLVEMPTLASLVLKHSGPFRSWVYAYDFTVIDLSTNREQYYTLNQYIGSLDRIMHLEEPNQDGNVHYPIDDVPLPSWPIEDIFLVLYSVINFIMLTVTLAPINCTYLIDIIVVLASAFLAGCLLFFMQWLLYYYLRWNQDRREYFNEYSTPFFCLGDRTTRILLGIMATVCGAAAIYFGIFVDSWRDGLVWLLANLNAGILVFGFWNIANQVEFCESIVALGMKVRGFTLVNVGMRFAEMVQDMRTKSGGSTSDSLSTGSATSKIKPVDTRSSVKSFGFNPITGHPSRPSPTQISRLSSTGATPNNQPPPHIVRQRNHRQARVTAAAIQKPLQISSQVSHASHHSTHHSKECSLKKSSKTSSGTNTAMSATPSSSIPSTATIATHQIQHKSDSNRTLKMGDKQILDHKHIRHTDGHTERSISSSKKQQTLPHATIKQ